MVLLGAVTVMVGLAGCATKQIFIPATVFLYRNSAVKYICVGTAYSNVACGWRIVLPCYIFPKGTTNQYAVQLAWRDHTFSEYIDSVTPCTDSNGVTVVFGKLGLRPRNIVGFFAREAQTNQTLLYFTNAVVVEHKRVTSLRSITTPDTVNLLGYCARSTTDVDRGHLVVEKNCTPRDIGSAFTDRNGRLFMLQSGLARNDPDFAAIDRYTVEHLNRHVSGIAFFVGPIAFE